MGRWGEYQAARDCLQKVRPCSVLCFILANRFALRSRRALHIIHGLPLRVIVDFRSFLNQLLSVFLSPPMPPAQRPSRGVTFFGMVAGMMAALKLKEKWDECGSHLAAHRLPSRKLTRFVVGLDRQLPTEPDGETGPLALHSPSREGATLPTLDTEIPATSARRTRKKADCCMCCGLRRVRRRARCRSSRLTLTVGAVCSGRPLGSYARCSLAGSSSSSSSGWLK